MSRPSGVQKHDLAARSCWGSAYDAIPKSVFALAAWHLANLASGLADAPGEAEKMFLRECKALAASGIITDAQAKAAYLAVIARFEKLADAAEAAQ